MKLLRPALALTLFFVVLTGLVFPAVIWGISKVAFPNQANGSLVKNAKGEIEKPERALGKKNKHENK